MTRAQKKQAEDFTKLLGRAHDGIKKTIERKNIEAALDLLSQCQECAIKLGEIIEAVEGEDFVTISLIEEYCEPGTAGECEPGVQGAPQIPGQDGEQH